MKKLRTFAFVATALSLPVLPMALSPIQASAAQTLAQAKANAAYLATVVQQDNAKVYSYQEQYDQAQIALASISSQINSTQSQIAAQQARVDTLRKKMASEAVNDYIKAGTNNSVLNLLQGTATDYSVSQEFMNTVASTQQDSVIQFQAAKSQLQVEQVKLQVEQTSASSTVAQIASDKASAQTAYQAAQTQLSQANTLETQLYQAYVAQQQAAAQRAAEAQAQAQAQAQLAQQSFAPPPPVNVGSLQAALAAAESVIGDRYVYGGGSPSSGFDCSGLVMWAYAHAGINFPHSAAGQYYDTARINLNQLQPGDLVFYFSPIDHVAIYVGNGQVLEANNPNEGVGYYSMYYVGSPIGYGRVQ